MIKIKNKEYELKFGFRAMLKFEEETGKSIAKIGENFMMADVLNIAYAILHKDLTKDEIIDAIDEDNTLLDQIMNSLSEDVAAAEVMSDDAKK